MWSHLIRNIYPKSTHTPKRPTRSDLIRGNCQSLQRLVERVAAPPRYWLPRLCRNSPSIVLRGRLDLTRRPAPPWDASSWQSFPHMQNGHRPVAAADRGAGGKGQTGGPRDARHQAQVRPPARLPGRGPRKPRPHGFSPPAHDSHPLRAVEHVLDACLRCGTGLSGGWTQRTRELIDLPVVPVQVTNMSSSPGTCPVCEKRRVPKVDLGGVTAGETAVGHQPAQPDGGPAGRGEAALPHRPVVSEDRPPVAPEPRRHRPGHPPSGPAGPTGLGRILERIRGSLGGPRV